MLKQCVHLRPTSYRWPFLQVLHMDRNSYYGGESASFNLTQARGLYSLVTVPASTASTATHLLRKLVLLCAGRRITHPQCTAAREFRALLVRWQTVWKPVEQFDWISIAW